jgi:hypothetical protein
MLAIIQYKIFCIPVSYKKNLKIKIYKTVILPVVLHGCETRSLTLREEHRRDMWHAWRRGEMFTKLWLGGPKVRDHWEDIGEGGK